MWYYFGFPFLAMFRLAGLTYRLIYNFSPYTTVKMLGYSTYNYAVQIIQWWWWWTQFTLLHLIRWISVIWYPVYAYFLIRLDISTKVTRRNRSKRIRTIQSHNEKYFILPLAGNLCVFTEAFNVYAENLTFLAKPLPST